ncbi:MAG: hypothetical protein EBW80_07625, partial [Burkholderiaceae bacterium]|nr:hypothetical protein [Burkholderiaceae bacterium]
KNVLPQELQVVTKRQPTPTELADLMFAWRVAKFVKSNAIVYCANGMTLGIGAGQMSRIDSARIASIKAEHAGLSLKGSAVASDAFFPFRDGLDVVVAAGATSVIQPGGSMRDPEAEYSARGIKQAIVGTGRANKTQMQEMVKRLLKLKKSPSPDAADALGVAICAAHHHQVQMTKAKR